MITDRAPKPSRSSLVDLKERNEWRVIEVLRDVGEVSRSELVAMTGLSRSTVANVVGELLQRGLVDERLPAAPRRSGRGRPGTVVSLRSNAGVAIGVAIDREHVRVVAVDLAATVLGHAKEEIPPTADGVDTLIIAARLIRGLLGEIGKNVSRVVGVGLGLPGPVDVERGGVDRDATLRRWAGVNAREELSRRLGGVHVYPDNDANFGALGEFQHGAGRGVENLLYIRVGPGVGGGLIIGGRLYRGEIGYAGELGHVPAVADGKPCTCGRHGCLSSVAASWEIVASLGPEHGPGLTIERVLALAADDDPRAVRALREAGMHSGRALSGAVSTLNPGLIVLGGDVGAHSPDFAEAFAKRSRPTCFPRRPKRCGW